MDKLEAGDILIVTKLDRLSRDSIDVSSTVNALAEMGGPMPRALRSRPHQFGRHE